MHQVKVGSRGDRLRSLVLVPAKPVKSPTPHLSSLRVLSEPLGLGVESVQIRFIPNRAHPFLKPIQHSEVDLAEDSHFDVEAVVEQDATKLVVALVQPRQPRELDSLV